MYKLFRVIADGEAAATAVQDGAASNSPCVRRMAVLITGGTRGLGLSSAKAAAAAGANVVITGTDASAAERTAAAIAERAAGRVIGLPYNAADFTSAYRLTDRVLSELGRLDGLVLNAAEQGPIGPFAGGNWNRWEGALSVNLLGPAALAHASIQHLSADGSVVFLSGGGATGPRPNFSSYACAKTALVRLAETLAHELVETGIRVNSVAPGAMPTDMLRAVVQENSSHLGEKELMTARDLIESDSTAAMEAASNLICFLLSDASRSITGRLISAVWDRWADWPSHAEDLAKSDAYTLRRVTGTDRGFAWGDK